MGERVHEKDLVDSLNSRNKLMLKLAMVKI